MNLEIPDVSKAQARPPPVINMHPYGEGEPSQADPAYIEPTEYQPQDEYPEEKRLLKADEEPTEANLKKIVCKSEANAGKEMWMWIDLDYEPKSSFAGWVEPNGKQKFSLPTAAAVLRSKNPWGKPNRPVVDKEKLERKRLYDEIRGELEQEYSATAKVRCVPDPATQQRLSELEQTLNNVEQVLNSMSPTMDQLVHTVSTVFNAAQRAKCTNINEYKLMHQNTINDLKTIASLTSTINNQWRSLAQ